VKNQLISSPGGFLLTTLFALGRWVSGRCEYLKRIPIYGGLINHALLTAISSIRVNGAECGIEAIALGVVTSIGGFLFGYDTVSSNSITHLSIKLTIGRQGQISGILIFEDFLRRFGEPDPNAATGYSIAATRSSILVSLMSIGSLLGALFGAYTSDWWGRRRNLAFGVIIFVLGNIVQITAMQSWIHMMMGRFLAGIGVGILSVGKFEENVHTTMDTTNVAQVYPCSNPNAAHVRSEVLWLPHISS